MKKYLKTILKSICHVSALGVFLFCVTIPFNIFGITDPNVTLTRTDYFFGWLLLIAIGIGFIWFTYIGLEEETR